jgi:hypothetical protein
MSAKGQDRTSPLQFSTTKDTPTVLASGPAAGRGEDALLIDASADIVAASGLTVDAGLIGASRCTVLESLGTTRA